jgi:hypothetical protein
MGKHVNNCKYCNLEFNEKNKDSFPLEKHILKDGTYGFHYRRSRCKKCTNLFLINTVGKTTTTNRSYIRYLKTNRPCKDCNKHYPHYVMHFDHLKDKVFNIGSSTSKASDIFRKEISKCDVVCANCHAERTHIRKIQQQVENY